MAKTDVIAGSTGHKNGFAFGENGQKDGEVREVSEGIDQRLSMSVGAERKFGEAEIETRWRRKFKQKGERLSLGE